MTKYGGSDHNDNDDSVVGSDLRRGSDHHDTDNVVTKSRKGSYDTENDVAKSRKGSYDTVGKYRNGSYDTDKDVVTGQLKVPNYVCYDYAGNVYVTDSEESRLHAYDTELQHVFTYGHGTGDSELNSPAGVVVDRYGNVLVADRGHSRVHLLDKQGRRKLCLMNWEDGIVEPQAMALTEEGHLVLSEASTGLIKIFSYTHIPEVTATLSVVNEELASIDDGASLQSADDTHEDLTTPTNIETPQIPNNAQATPKAPSFKSSNTDVESFKRSLQMLQNQSTPDDYKTSLGFQPPLNSKTGWSQISSHHFQSVPSTAAPRRLESRRERLAMLNREFTDQKGSPQFNSGGVGDGLSASTPNIHGTDSPPPNALAGLQGGKHLSDLTRPVFQLDSQRMANDSQRMAIDSQRMASTGRNSMVSLPENETPGPPPFSSSRNGKREKHVSLV